MVIKKVLLINPNYQKKISSLSQISIGPPLGLAYIASLLKRKGISVRIIDANAENIGPKEIMSVIKRELPDLIGLTSVTPTIDLCNNLSFKIKKVFPNLFIVVGGIHPSLSPEETLKNNPNIDFLVIGEGEYTFSDLISALNEKTNLSRVRGIGWRKGHRVIINKNKEPIKNLDDLPFPARDLLPNEKYRSIEFNHFTTIIAMRGCPGSCIFCAVPHFCGRKIRKRSVENVIAEIEECIEKYHIKSFSFLDDTFTYDMNWVIDFCDKMIEKKLNEKVKWLCLARVDNITLSLLKKMKNAGCYKIEFGVESGSPRILNKIGKGISIEQIKNAFKMAKDTGLATMAFVMVGFPFESKSDIIITKKLVKDIEPLFLQVSYVTPYPKTTLYKYCSKKGLLKTNDLSKYIFLNNSVIVNEKNLSSEQIIRLKKDIERSFYLRPSHLIRTFFYLLKNSETFFLFLNRCLIFLENI